MQKKYGKFYADWRDAQGQRHRKAFPTKKQAQHFSSRMRLTEARKKARASAQSARSARRGPRPRQTTAAASSLAS